MSELLIIDYWSEVKALKKWYVVMNWWKVMKLVKEWVKRLILPITIYAWVSGSIRIMVVFPQLIISFATNYSYSSSLCTSHHFFLKLTTFSNFTCPGVFVSMLKRGIINPHVVSDINIEFLAHSYRVSC